LTAAIPDRLPLATLRRRLAALVYEALIVVALLFVASFALAPFVSPSALSSHALDVPTLGGRIVSLVALFLLGGLFFGWCWSRGRRTLPMKTWRLALVDVGGRSLSTRDAWLRYAVLWIGPALAVVTYAVLAPHGFGALAWPVAFLNWLAALVDPDRQFLHDRLAGTRVIAA
jgi:uncharacterized RDD family membrane protein YckC